jgi:hypothetical protein
MLPFYLIGFPPHGFLEWIAESLTNLTIDTHTPYGNCDTTVKALPSPAPSLTSSLGYAPWPGLPQP